MAHELGETVDRLWVAQYLEDATIFRCRAKTEAAAIAARDAFAARMNGANQKPLRERLSRRDGAIA